jgi:RHS repeat-associated protein
MLYSPSWLRRVAGWPEPTAAGTALWTGDFDMAYDFKGNVTSRPPLTGEATFTYTWDAFDRLKSAARSGMTTVNTIQDAGGALEKSYALIPGALEKSYALIPGAAIGGYLGVQSGEAGGDAGASTPAWSRWHHHYNDLGTVIAATDEDGAKIGVYTPDFWGNYRESIETETLQALRDSLDASSLDADDETIAELLRANGLTLELDPRPDTLGLTSKFFDDWAGLYYFGARWYDPERGRWISEEPLGLDGPNRYHFGFNSPLDGFDVDGLSWRIGGNSNDKNDWGKWRKRWEGFKDWIGGWEVPGPGGRSNLHWDDSGNSWNWGDPLSLSGREKGDGRVPGRVLACVAAVAVVSVVALEVAPTTLGRIPIRIPRPGRMPSPQVVCRAMRDFIRKSCEYRYTIGLLTRFEFSACLDAAQFTYRACLAGKT